MSVHWCTNSDGFLLARLESGLFIDFGCPSDLAIEDDQKILFMRDPLSVHFFFIFKDFSAKIMPKNKLAASLVGASPGNPRSAPDPCRGGSTIHRRRGCQSSRREGRQHTNLPDFPKNCMKLRKFWSVGRRRRRPLGSATAMHTDFLDPPLVDVSLTIRDDVNAPEGHGCCSWASPGVPGCSVWDHPLLLRISSAHRTNYFLSHGTLQSCWKRFKAPLTPEIYYRPQTKFAKVMFLHVSVCPQGEYLGRYTPGQVPPRVGTPLGRYTPPWAGTPPPGQVHPQAGTPLDRYTSHPQPQCMLGYDQQAGSTHPTGMHSC